MAVAGVKKSHRDFVFGKVLGEGSYSTVYLAKEVETGKEFAIKVLEKNHITRERKTKYVMREKRVFVLLNHPFFIKMAYSFQDHERLYFVLTYAKRGELLDYLRKLSSFDEQCTQFYAAEIILALEHLHGLKIIHRDLKPENILLNEDMHIQITDFGSAKLVDQEDANETTDSNRRRTNSFVGTAQYVSPEILTGKEAHYSSDLWALGCIIYQLLSGLPPFRGSNEYLIFQKITKLDYEFPEGFHPVARDLVEQLLVLDPTERLGCAERDGYTMLKAHPFFSEIHWEKLHKQKAPELLPYLPATTNDPGMYGSRPGLDDIRIGEMITQAVIPELEKQKILAKQASENCYHRFVEGNLILKQGLIDKRRGLFARRRMFLLTEGPHLYYVDPSTKVLKGQIPWSVELRPEAKNFKIFFVHTPHRTYYLEDPEARSSDWVNKIKEVWQRYYGNKQ